MDISHRTQQVLLTSMMCKTLLMLVLDGSGNTERFNAGAYIATGLINGVLNYKEENVTQVWSFHLRHIGLAKSPF